MSSFPPLSKASFADNPFIGNTNKKLSGWEGKATYLTLYKISDSNLKTNWKTLIKPYLWGICVVTQWIEIFPELLLAWTTSIYMGTDFSSLVLFRKWMRAHPALQNISPKLMQGPPTLLCAKGLSRWDKASRKHCFKPHGIYIPFLCSENTFTKETQTTSR